MPDDDTTITTAEQATDPRDVTPETGAAPGPAARTRRRRAAGSTARSAAGRTPDDGPADATEGEAIPAVASSPRKRTPRTSASRRRTVDAQQSDAQGVLEPASAPDTETPRTENSRTETPRTAAPSVEAPAMGPSGTVPVELDSGPDVPGSGVGAADPAPPEVSTPESPAAAPPRARAARASSGFALLARAAPVFSHSPTPPSVAPGGVPPVVLEPAATADVTPESLLAALDAVAPPTGGRSQIAAAAVPAVPVFVPPVPVFVDPADYWGAPADARDTDEDESDDLPGVEDEAVDAEVADGGDDSEEIGETGDDGSAVAGARRRRRRGGRRRRGASDRAEEEPAGGPRPAAPPGAVVDPGSDEDDETEDPVAEDADGAAAPAAPDGADGADSSDGDAGGEGTEDGTSGSRRRRRRRRRGAEDGDAPTADDPPDTVVRVREPRRTRAKREDGDSEITAARGSTRIEAKKQRRRDGREARKRPPILSEAEFLARRESVARSMLVRDLDGRTQIAVLEDGMLVEHYIAEDAAPTDRSLIGDVYLGRVQNVLPAMEAAFVDIGRGRNAVLYAGEVDWDGLGMEGKPKRIELALKSGQSVLVQVTKDPIGQKGARLTSQISLAGRYLVLVPNGSMSGISRKLPDAERSRLKKILRELLPPKAGVIVRTAAEGATEAELAADVARLTGQWDEISSQAATASAPALLQGEPNLATKVVRDIFNEDFTSLVVSGEKVLTQIRSYIGSVAPNLLERVSPWTAEDDLFAANRVDEQLVKALDRKVFLPSGGSLVIDRTEAMTVVDVNTGRFTGSGGNLEETVTENNLEAAEELVRQLRLRDIGGIIVVDFIDMVFESNRDLVVRRLVECLGRDRTRHQVAEVSSLGLVQMTRKRIGRGLLEVFGRPCETCRGRGMVVDLNGHGITDHEPAAPGSGTPPRIPNPGNTGRAHLRTIVSAIPVGDLPAAPEPPASEPPDAVFEAPVGDAEPSDADVPDTDSDTDVPDTDSDTDVPDADVLDAPDADAPDAADTDVPATGEVLTTSETIEILSGLETDPELETVLLGTPTDVEDPGEHDAEQAGEPAVPTDPDDASDQDLAVVMGAAGGADQAEES